MLMSISQVDLLFGKPTSIGIILEVYKLHIYGHILFLPCGSRLACDHEGVRPDVILLGKALSGGTMPVSAHIAVPAELNTSSK